MYQACLINNRIIQQFVEDMLKCEDLNYFKNKLKIFLNHGLDFKFNYDAKNINNILKKSFKQSIDISEESANFFTIINFILINYLNDSESLEFIYNNLFETFNTLSKIHNFESFILEENDIDKEKNLILFINNIALYVNNSSIEFKVNQIESILRTLITHDSHLLNLNKSFPLPFLLFQLAHWTLFDILLKLKMRINVVNNNGVIFSIFYLNYEFLSEKDMPNKILIAKIKKELERARVSF